MSFRISQHVEILNEYQRIAENNLSQKIAFYRENEIEIQNIALNERIHIEKDFLLSLFQIGEFREYLDRCDDVIEKLFDTDLFPQFQKNTLSALLFHKAASQYNIHEYSLSKGSLSSLMKIDKSNQVVHMELLTRLFRKEYHQGKYRVRGIVIAMILFSAILSVWNVLFFNPFYPEIFPIAQSIMWSVLIIAVGIWIFSEQLIKRKAENRALRFCQEGLL
jgi:hypothetical protein